jgi:hypothetical protein
MHYALPDRFGASTIKPVDDTRPLRDSRRRSLCARQGEIVKRGGSSSSRSPMLASRGRRGLPRRVARLRSPTARRTLALLSSRELMTERREASVISRSAAEARSRSRRIRGDVRRTCPRCWWSSLIWASPRRDPIATSSATTSSAVRRSTPSSGASCSPRAIATSAG